VGDASFPKAQGTTVSDACSPPLTPGTESSESVGWSSVFLFILLIFMKCC
jgi:hypothetical protein